MVEYVQRRRYKVLHKCLLLNLIRSLARQIVEDRFHDLETGAKKQRHDNMVVSIHISAFTPEKGLSLG